MEYLRKRVHRSVFVIIYFQKIFSVAYVLYWAHAAHVSQNSYSENNRQLYIKMVVESFFIQVDILPNKDILVGIYRVLKEELF